MFPVVCSSMKIQTVIVPAGFAPDGQVTEKPVQGKEPFKVEQVVMLSVDRFAQEFAIVRAGRIVDIAVVVINRTACPAVRYPEGGVQFPVDISHINPVSEILRWFQIGIALPDRDAVDGLNQVGLL